MTGWGIERGKPMSQTFTAPRPDSKQWEVKAVSNNLQWVLYERFPPQIGEWRNYRLIRKGRHIHRVSFWFAYNFKEKRFIRHRDVLYLREKHLVIYQWLESIFIRKGKEGHKNFLPSQPRQLKLKVKERKSL